MNNRNRDNNPSLALFPLERTQISGYFSRHGTFGRTGTRCHHFDPRIRHRANQGRGPLKVVGVETHCVKSRHGVRVLPTANTVSGTQRRGLTGKQLEDEFVLSSVCGEADEKPLAVGTGSSTGGRRRRPTTSEEAAKSSQASEAL